MHQAYLLLGSNIEPEKNIPQAVKLLQDKLTVIKASSVWQSASVECCYPDYLNLALCVETALDARQLKEEVLRPLEAQMGRVRSDDINAPRPIDFDIILFDEQLLDPPLWEHAHRAIPMAELHPGFLSESGETLEDAARRLALSTPIQVREDITIHLAGG